MKHFLTTLLSLPGLLLIAAEPPSWAPPVHHYKRAAVIGSEQVQAGTTRPADFTARRSLNGVWKFSGVENSAEPFAEDAGPAAPAFDASGWKEIPVPLNWYQFQPEARNSGQPYVRGWYRKEFDLSAADLADRRVILRFGCVGYDAKVYLNGREVGSHHGDFTPFEIDATEAAREGKNLLAVRVLSDFGPSFGLKEKATRTYGSQWSIGNIKGGIWQDVTLSLEPAVRVAKLLVTPDLAGEKIRIDAIVWNHSGTVRPVTLKGFVTSAMKEDANRPVGEASENTVLQPGRNSVSLPVALRNAQRWNTETPYLYFATLAVVEADKTVSASSARFGFREFRVQDGNFYLNGERIYLFGENIPSVVYGGTRQSAKDEEAVLEQFLLGCRNFGAVIVRNAHMPIVPVALEIADEIGLMIYDEWSWSFTDKIDEERFEKTNLKELAEFIERDYNHPSVVMWSLGNEVKHANRPDIVRQLDKQVELVRALDRQTRPISSFSGSGGWMGYGRNRLDTDVLDFHTYVALSEPWTDRDNEAALIARGLREIYGENRVKTHPLIAWENVGFSWGFLDESNKNADFKPGDVDQYAEYVKRKWNWGQPCGIGFTGCMSLADAVNPAVTPAVPMIRYGRRIFERYRLDPEFAGFAPWFSDPELRQSTVWNQPVLPTLRDRNALMPGNLFSGRSAPWTLEVVNHSKRAGEFTLSAELFTGSGKTLPVAQFPVKLDAWKNFTAEVKLPMPEVPAGFYQLRLTLRENGVEAARNWYDLYLGDPGVSDRKIEAARPVYVFDTGAGRNVERLTAMLKRAGIAFRIVRAFSGVEKNALVIVPPESDEPQKLALHTDPAASEFLHHGGTLLVLEQRNAQSALPGNLIVTADGAPYSDPIVTGHPVFAGLSARNFDTWSNPDRGYVVSGCFMPFNRNALAAKGAFLSRPAVGMSLLEAKVGDGRLIASQLNAFRSLENDSSAALFLANLLGYASGDARWDQARELVADRNSLYSIHPDRTVLIDLAPYANRGFSDEVDGDGKGGWTDQGGNDFRMMPTGVQEAAGIPFRIADPAKNDGKGCIVLRGSGKPALPEAARNIKVNQSLSKLFFLHTAAWSNQPEAGRYRIHYADGSHHDIALAGNRNIGDFWNPARLPEALPGIIRPNHEGRNVGTFVMEWINPHPTIRIDSIDFLSPLLRDGDAIDFTGKQTAVPILIAVTGEAVNPNRIEVTGKDHLKSSGSHENGSKLSGSIQKDGPNQWRIDFPAAPAGEIPAVFFSFDPAKAVGEYSEVVITARSDRDVTLQVQLPEKSWQGIYHGKWNLPGDGRDHRYRLRFGNELKPEWGKAGALRGELFLFDRDGWDGNHDRAPVRIFIRDIVIE